MKKSFLLLTVFAAVLQSCVKDIYLDPGEAPEVVVECVLTEEPVQELYLSYAKGVSQKEADPLPEAEVLLIDQSLDKTSFSFTNAGEGKWILDYSAIPGHSYRLEIKVPGRDLITAETKMPEDFEVKYGFYNTKGYIWSSDSRAEFIKVDNYGYSGGSYYYDIPDHCWIYFINDDGSIADNICTNYPGVDDFNLTGKVYIPEKGPKKKAWAYTEGDGWSQAIWEEGDSYLYPALEGWGLHDRFLRISSGKMFKGKESYSGSWEEIVYRFSKSYMISGSFKTQEGSGQLWFEVMSEEYDQYLAAAMRSVQFENSTDISKIYLRENILETNVNGGLGIFGAKIRHLSGWSR